MTIVYAKKFGNRVIVCSDTMITNRNETSPDAIPGVLKSVILGEDITVGYAGAAEPGINFIQKYYNRRIRNNGSDEAISFFQEASRENCGETDYIVVSHRGSGEARIAEISKISSGRVNRDLESAYIGCDYSLIERIEMAAMMFPKPSIEPPPDYGSSEEHAFIQAFRAVILDRESPSFDGVGGLPVLTLCSPYGHCYLAHGGVSRWDEFVLFEGVTVQQEHDLATGMTQFSYWILGSSVRGSPVLGAYFEQARCGWIYDPINYDMISRPATFRLSDISVDDFSRCVEHWAIQRKHASSPARPLSSLARWNG